MCTIPWDTPRLESSTLFGDTRCGDNDDALPIDVLMIMIMMIIIVMVMGMMLAHGRGYPSRYPRGSVRGSFMTWC